MKREKNIKTSRNLPFLLKVYFIAGTVLLVSAALLYNNSLMKRMSAQAESTASLFARFVGISLVEAENEANRNFFREIRSSIADSWDRIAEQEARKENALNTGGNTHD